MIKAVLFDFMNTVAVFPRGENRYDAYTMMLRERAEIQCNREEVKKEYDRARSLIEHELKFESKPVPEDLYAARWSLINATLIRGVAARHHVSPPDNPIELGAEIYRRLMSDSCFYEVRPEMREFLVTLEDQGIQRILATNQQRRLVDKMLKSLEIEDLFDAIYVSDEVGYEKPQKEFFSHILDEIELRPYQVAMVGNNVKNDLCGAASATIQNLFLLSDNKPEPKPDDPRFVWSDDPRSFLSHIQG